VISDTIDHPKTLAMVDAARIGLLEFSLGGHLCLRLRAKANILVELFAPMLDGIGQANGGSLTHAQIHHGEADNLPATGYNPNATAIARLLEQEGTSTELFPYSVQSTVSSATIRTMRARATFRRSEPSPSSKLVCDVRSTGKSL
jgi:hypothetical protein